MSEYTPISDEMYYELLKQLADLRAKAFGLIRGGGTGKEEACCSVNKQIFDIEVILCKAARSGYPGSNFYPENVCLAAGARLMSRLEAYQMGYGGVLTSSPTLVMVYPEGHPFNERAQKLIELPPMKVPIRGNGGVSVAFDQEGNIVSIGKLPFDLIGGPASYLIPVE